LETNAILIATGRKPNTDLLGLTRIGIQMDHDHIAVKNTLQTSISHIYAVGDVIKPFPFTHAAGMEGKIVVGNAVFGLNRKVSYDNVQWVTYTDPEIFHLGMTEDEARKHAGDDIQTYKVTLDHVDRFITDRNTEGIVKVITDRKGKILGAHAAGNGAGDWMQQAVFAKRFGHKLSYMSLVVTDARMFNIEIQPGASYAYRLLPNRTLAGLAIRGDGGTFWTSGQESVSFKNKDFAIVQGEQEGEINIRAAGEKLRIFLIEIPSEVEYPLYKKAR
jgi:hypothetical protein